MVFYDEEDVILAGNFHPQESKPVSQVAAIKEVPGGSAKPERCRKMEFGPVESCYEEEPQPLQVHHIPHFGYYKTLLNRRRT